MSNPNCRFCNLPLDPVAVVARDLQLEGAGPDLAWGCPHCNTLFEVFLADDPQWDDDMVAALHDQYHPDENQRVEVVDG